MRPTPLTEQELASLREAARCRMSVLRNFDKPERGLRMACELAGWGPAELADPEAREAADRIRHDLITMLAEAETFVGTEEICRLLDATAPSYPLTAVTFTNILTGSGMVHFDTPIEDPQKDVAIRYPIRALSWSLAPAGGDDARGDYDRSPQIRSTGSYELTIIGYTDTRTIPEFRGQDLGVLPRIYPITSVIWQVEARDGEVFFDERQTREQAERSRGPYVKTLMAYFAIMGQRLAEKLEPIVKVSPKEIERARRRRPVNDTMHIIRMRPRQPYEYTGDHGFNRPDWQFQWGVRSHWRRRSDKEAILILGYIKGPPDKKIRGADRLFLPPPERPQ